MLGRHWTRWILPLALALSAAAAPGAKDGKKLVVWGWIYSIDCLKTNMDDFSKAYPDIEVNFRNLAPGQIYLNLPPVLASGVGLPDVVVLEDSHLPAMISTGGLTDLSARAAVYRSRFNAFKWAAVSSGSGRVYAMPWDSAPVAVFYRRDIFARAGLPSAPEEVAALLATWEDYLAAAKTIKEKTGAYMLPFAATKNDGRFFEMLLQQQGLGYFNKNGAVAVDNPQAVRTLEFIGRLYREGLTHESVAWEDPWYAAIRKGEVATVITGVHFDSFLRNWIAPQTSGLWGIVPLPAWAGGAGARTSNDGGTSLAIPKRAKQAEAAWEFVRFMLTRKESQLNMMKAQEAFPALEDVYDDPFFSEPSPFYGGQAPLKIFADLARQIPPWYYTEDYPTANSICSAEIQSFLAGNKDAGAALLAAAKAIRAKTNRK